METRDFEIREFNEETRTIKGLAVPYDETIDLGGFSERFERGAFGTPTDVKLFYSHSEPIGRVTRGEDTDEGYEIEAVISKTARGDEVYTLLRDGVLNKFSVGFLPDKDRKDGKTIVRESVHLKEVSVVAFPAYSGASVTQVRDADSIEDKENEMTESTVNAAEVADLRESVEDLERRFAVAMTAKNEGTGSSFTHAGEFLKALARNDEKAQMEIRDFGTTADADVTRPGWVNERMRLALEKRPTINAFSKSPLPASGNSVEYPYVKTVSGTVTQQANEGDNLSYMEVALDTATAPVKTYGGYSSLSRQAIERSDLAYLETVLEYQVNQYAKATEKAVRDALVGATGTNTATLAADTAEGWIDLVVDSAAAIEDNSLGLGAEFVLVSGDVFKRIAHMVDDTGRPLFAISGQSVNSLGSSNLLTPSANIGGLPVIVNRALSANTVWVASSGAVKTWESSGAPFRLQDENIINLTKDFALYGYLAVGVLNAKGLVKVDADLTA